MSSLTLDDGDQIQARHYIDASGHSGILRRALGVGADSPTTLQNIAIWDYWQNAEWAVEIGVGGTRVQVMSVGYGWLWFIPLGPTRTSIGLVVPAEYYKSASMSPEALYMQAIKDDERISTLVEGGSREGSVNTTKDWSFLAERHVGKNWFLTGEAAGFADPILAAGMTLAQMSAREAAYTILELEAGKLNHDWLKQEYNRRQTRRITNHIRFADYWYTANAQFSDLQDFTARLAADNGFDLAPDKAWAWLAQGGFIDDDAGLGPAGFSFDQVKDLGDFMNEMCYPAVLTENNVFLLNLSGAQWHDHARYSEGKVQQIGSYMRGERVLPLTGVFEMVVNILQQNTKITGILDQIRFLAQKHQADEAIMSNLVLRIPEAMEAMISDGWIAASYDPLLPLPPLPPKLTFLEWNTDPVRTSIPHQ